jgi:hypothetical protein
MAYLICTNAIHCTQVILFLALSLIKVYLLLKMNIFGYYKVLIMSGSYQLSLSNSIPLCMCTVG